jgi:hypothetical protein
MRPSFMRYQHRLLWSDALLYDDDDGGGDGNEVLPATKQRVTYIVGMHPP